MSQIAQGCRRPVLTIVAATAAIGGLLAPADIVHAKSGVVVDDDRAQCRNADFTSIQAAVAAATPGTTISVCPGTYVEQVTIPGSKGALTLESRQKWRAIIKAPLLMAGPGAIVRVTGATGVTIRNFTITGRSGSACDVRAGVLVDAAGAAVVERNQILDVRNEPLSGCDGGNAVEVGSSTGGPGAALVRDNLLERYQRTGVHVWGNDSAAAIENNIITGLGPTATEAQHGISVSGGASATVVRNTISANIYTPQTLASAGILLHAPGNVDVERNVLTRNDVSIYALGVTGDATIKRNTVSFSTFDGIALLDSTAVTVLDNRSTNNGAAGNGFGPGIGVYGVTQSTFAGNRVESNSGGGLFFDIDTADNSISNNRAYDNTPFDCEDQTDGTERAGTANYWTANRAETENRPGLCTKVENNEPSVQKDRELQG